MLARHALHPKRAHTPHAKNLARTLTKYITTPTAHATRAATPHLQLRQPTRLTALTAPAHARAALAHRQHTPTSSVRALAAAPRHDATNKRRYTDVELADHAWRQTNHIWSPTEVQQRMEQKNVKHVPENLGDRVVQWIVGKVLYRGFNWVTGYRADNPPVRSVEWRLIFLEAFAGVPGFIGAGFRHFRSLRMLERDHGFIFSLLEEAENERMHLLVCMKMFEAGILTRSLVIASQFVATPVLMGVYIVKPQALHRFVGYLEETAVHTYANLVQATETPGTLVHEAWKDVPAPEIAINYWKLKSDAKWVDCLKMMLADESHHRDVNHAFASMDNVEYYNKDNPFIHEHMADYDDHVRRHTQKLLKSALKAIDDPNMPQSTSVELTSEPLSGDGRAASASRA